MYIIIKVAIPKNFRDICHIHILIILEFRDKELKEKDFDDFV